MKYLTEAWVAAADAALAGLDPDPDAGRVGYRIERPGGQVEFAYTLVLGPDRCGAELGVDEAPVILVLDRATADGIARHELSAQREFLNGAMRIDGDVSVLLASQRQATLAEPFLTGVTNDGIEHN